VVLASSAGRMRFCRAKKRNFEFYDPLTDRRLIVVVLRQASSPAIGDVEKSDRYGMAHC